MISVVRVTGVPKGRGGAVGQNVDEASPVFAVAHALYHRKNSLRTSMMVHEGRDVLFLPFFLNSTGRKLLPLPYLPYLSLLCSSTITNSGLVSNSIEDLMEERTELDAWVLAVAEEVSIRMANGVAMLQGGFVITVDELRRRLPTLPLRPTPDIIKPVIALLHEAIVLQPDREWAVTFRWDEEGCQFLVKCFLAFDRALTVIHRSIAAAHRRAPAEIAPPHIVLKQPPERRSLPRKAKKR